jgi:DNA-binding NarL/FixJ family response regulator
MLVKAREAESLARARTPVTILIVDDDAANRQIVKRILDRAAADIKGGIRVAEGEDGEEAIRLTRELSPDVVVMDIAMPRLNGLEATKQIKAEWPDTKVIVLTVHDEKAYREAANAMGADAFLAKKTVMTELLPTVKTAVGIQ